MNQKIQEKSNYTLRKVLENAIFVQGSGTNISIVDKNGNIVSFKTVTKEEDLMIITTSGIIIRLPIEQISTTGRVAQGVKLINLKDNQRVSNITVIEKDNENSEE